MTRKSKFAKDQKELEKSSKNVKGKMKNFHARA
jgi:hypothetical protein